MAAVQCELIDDPTALTDHHRPDDRFVPLRAGDLVDMLAADEELLGPDAPLLRDVAAALEDVIEQETTAFQRDLLRSYAAVNPDRDTRFPDDVETRRTPAAHADLLRRITYLLEKANFEDLTQVQVDAAVRKANSLGVRVRLEPERVEQLRVWVRGQASRTRHVRTWRHPLRGMPREIDVYRRLAVYVRLKNDPYVRLRLFKDIPSEDIEALLPHAQVGMNLLDQLKLFGSGAGALGTTAWKLVQALAIGTGALLTLGWIILVGCFSLGIKTLTGYRAARVRRDSLRTRHLYFQNLANNAGVIHSLLAMIAQEEVKEALLAYAFCTAAKEPDLSAAQLDRNIEAYLHERFGVAVNFDADDALETLARLDLFIDRSRLSVCRPAQAVQRLRRHWQQRLSQDYHARSASGGSASSAPPSTRAGVV